MCGRFTNLLSWREIVELYGITNTDFRPNLAPRYNVAPSQDVPVVKAGRELAVVRWGLIPFWAKDEKIAWRTINARAETVAEKPAFRAAYKARRCLVPASGFYEWQARGKGPKQPWYITGRDGRPLAFAGLWERWQGPDGSVESCTIVVTDPADNIVIIVDTSGTRWGSVAHRCEHRRGVNTAHPHGRVAARRTIIAATISRI